MTNDILPHDALLARHMLCSCVCGCAYLSAASLTSIKEAKYIILQSTPHDSTVKFQFCQSPVPNGGAKYTWVEEICDMRQVKPNSIMLSWSQTGQGMVADLQRAGIWPITSSELARPSRSATSLGPVCDQDSVMEFGLLRPAANLVADRFAVGLSQIPLC